MPYLIEALLAVFRIVLWFILLFGIIAPSFLEYARTSKGIEKLIIGWVGLSGVIIFVVFVLTVLHIYDFISLVLTLLLIAIVRSVVKSQKSLPQYFSDLEIEALIKQIQFSERYSGLIASGKAYFRKPIIRFSYSFLAICIALVGGIIRLVPGLVNAAPFNRTWYFALDRVKNIQLQDYFSGNPEPAGMHVFISVFSMLTQVPSELILHLMGALVSFFLCIIIYWAILRIIGNELPAAPILGMSIYALTPGLVMPVSMDTQILANPVELALCFALPVVIIFADYLKNGDKRSWFYICSGFIATGMTSLFVAFAVLLPMLVIVLLYSWLSWYSRPFIKMFGYLAGLSAITLSPVFLYHFLYGIDLPHFFVGQMLDTGMFSYYPQLIMPIDTLSSLFLGLAGMLGIGYLLEFILGKNRNVRNEVVFLLIFAVFSSLYILFTDAILFGIDADQFNPFYSIMIAIFIGMMFATFMRWGNILLRFQKKAFRFSSMAGCVLILSSALYVQGGVQLSRQLPSTIPNGFQNAYYAIIGNHLPYSYATVAPEIARIAAKNRHYFMDYEYFLSEYTKIDSLYQLQPHLQKNERKTNAILPAGIFLFVEKPPYGSIQQGILYDSPTVMKNIERWVAAYRKEQGRTVRTYYQDEKAVVYQIVNRERESEIDDILSSIYPNKISERQGDE